jgi:hypothetical protein
MYWLTTADKSTLNKSTFNVSANVSAAFLRRSAVEPDRIRTAADAALGFFARRTGAAVFFPAVFFAAVFVLFALFPLITLAAIFSSYSSSYVESPTPSNLLMPASDYAEDGLRILSAIDHNNQRLTSAHRKIQDDANGAN